ncbi:integral membrane protein GPR180 [Patella vulgata]|uniref:integral membrane protein GPR180 n=1 Tax=Patella vulgata TaxID=6465 RepID=UPI00217FC753|nr:integral membrane protein GPR180 [Patella vulgata]
MRFIYFFFVYIFSCVNIVDSKTTLGTFNSFTAQVEGGQYISSFCFHGDAVLRYSLNTTGNTPVYIYLYLNEDWRDARQDDNCLRQLNKARLVYHLNATKGNLSVSHFVKPRIWHVVYSDAYTCDVDRPRSPLEQPNYVQYNISFFNPDSLGNPTEHFGDDETGLLRFYQLLTLGYFVLACIFAPRLYQTLSKGGPMQLVIQLLTTSVCLQSVGGFLMMLHLRSYSKDGMGSPFKELLSELFDVLSQFAMLYMLLSLSLGWTLASAHCRYTHLSVISKKPAAKVVGVLGILQGFLFLSEQYEDRGHRMFHAHRSYAGISLVVLRILLAALFAWNLHSTIAAERSSLKRGFYGTFTKLCMLWFLCFPFAVAISWIIPEYLRFKLITMGVVLIQSLAGALLYRLFLSRSLYWEVSALSSTLPLRMDRNFGIKLYS